MSREMITKLTTGLAHSAVYRAAVKAPTALELKAASKKRYGKKGTKTRLGACDRELRVRGAVKNEKEH